MRLTRKHADIMQRVKAGTLYQCQTGTREGNMVRTLIRHGVLDSRHRHFYPPGTTSTGARLPGCMWHGGLFVTAKGEEALGRLGTVGADL